MGIMDPKSEIFGETYKVVAVEDRTLTIQGLRSGEVLTINPITEAPLKAEDYPPGGLIELRDPSEGPRN
jgi:hypothetical protein